MHDKYIMHCVLEYHHPLLVMSLVPIWCKFGSRDTQCIIYIHVHVHVGVCIMCVQILRRDVSECSDLRSILNGEEEKQRYVDLNAGYIQHCIIDQGFEDIQQYDAFRYIYKQHSHQLRELRNTAE